MSKKKWILSQKSQKKDVAHHQANSKRDLTEHTVVLAALQVNNDVMVQNQADNNKFKWEFSGLIVEVLPFDQYQVRIYGLCRVMLRNRKYLWQKTTPFPKSV